MRMAGLRLPVLAVSSLWMLLLAPLMHAQDDELERMLSRVSADASSFWSNAPGFIGQETWREKATFAPQSAHRRIRFGADALNKPQATTTVREVVSLYALGSYRRSLESLFEFRKVIAIDGKKEGNADTARSEMAAGLRRADDKWRHRLRENFESQAMAGVMVDFGQLIMLFTKPRLKEYKFSLQGTERAGADVALVVHFEQRLGRQSLRISDGGGKQDSKPLEGEILLRDFDYGVLQIRLSASRTQDSRKLRDEAQVDYARNSAGALLPASIVHRRFVDEKLDYEDVFEYSDWQEFSALNRP